MRCNKTTRLNVETRCACKATQTFYRPYPPVAATPCTPRNRLCSPPPAPSSGSCPSAPPGQLYSQCSSHGVRGDFTMTNETTTRSRHACTAASHCSSHGVRGEFTTANGTTTLSRHACTATHKYACIRMLFVDQYTRLRPRLCEARHRSLFALCGTRQRLALFCRGRKVIRKGGSKDAGGFLVAEDNAPANHRSVRHHGG